MDNLINFEKLNYGSDELTQSTDIFELSENYNYKKLIINTFLNNSKETCQFVLDTAADLSLISLGSIKKLIPDWKGLPKAKDINLKSYSGHNINVIAAKKVKISFLHTKGG